MDKLLEFHQLIIRWMIKWPASQAAGEPLAHRPDEQVDKLLEFHQLVIGRRHPRSKDAARSRMAGEERELSRGRSHSSIMRRKWLLAIGAAVLAFVMGRFAYYSLDPDAPVAFRSAKVTKGMTKQDVEALLGEPGEPYTQTRQGQVRSWRAKETSTRVLFDENDVVIDSEDIIWEPTFWQCLQARLQARFGR